MISFLEKKSLAFSETQKLFDLVNNNKNKFDKMILEFQQSINEIEGKHNITGYNFFSANVPRELPKGNTLDEIYKFINMGYNIAKNDFHTYCTFCSKNYG